MEGFELTVQDGNLIKYTSYCRYFHAFKRVSESSGYSCGWIWIADAENGFNDLQIRKLWLNLALGQEINK